MIVRRDVPPDLPNDVTFAEELLATIRVILKHNGECPECKLGGMTYDGVRNHGLSQIHIGDDCHLGQLMRIADAAAL